MRPPRLALVVCLLLGSWSAPAWAQTDRRAFVHADLGFGSMEDDEGSLGKGLAFGAAIGGTLLDNVQIEFSATRMHHDRAVAISWEGHIASFVGRLIYRGGGPGSAVRWFAGAGAGYYAYEGTITDTIFPTITSTPTVERFDYSFGGLVYETGGGIEIAAGGNAFLRPELWVTIPRGERIGGGRTPEPPFLIARGTVVAGLRF